MRQNVNKQLAKDLVIYGIGNIGNKFLMFLLFPVLLFFMRREELGAYDVPFEVVLFLLPLVTLQMRESTFRLLVDNNDESYRRCIISGTLFVEGVMFLIVFFIAIVISFFFSIRFFHLIILSIYAYSLYEIYIQAVRSIYSSTQYALINIINSFLTIVLTLLLYFVFKKGVEGLFWGNILARLFSISIFELPRRQVIRNVSIRHVNKRYIKEILSYSLPLLLSALAFAFIASPGKFIVNYFYGNDHSGLLAAAQKYMNILLVLGWSFYQAWQVTAVKNYQEQGHEKYFSEVFNKYAAVLFLIVLCISFGLRAFKFLVGPDFHQSIQLIFIYCVSSTFFCLALFFETIYQCTKQTSKLLYSIISCACISLPLTFVLTKYFGLTGNLTALTLAYLYLFIFRFFQTKSIQPIRFNKIFSFSSGLLAVGGIIFYSTNNIITDYIVFTIAALLLLFFMLGFRKQIHDK